MLPELSDGFAGELVQSDECASSDNSREKPFVLWQFSTRACDLAWVGHCAITPSAFTCSAEEMKSRYADPRLPYNHDSLGSLRG